MKTILVAASIVVLATGCASHSEEYQMYVKAQLQANTAAAADQKPLVEITAQPGQNITGLASLKVYTPQQAAIIQQNRPNEWAGVVGQGLGVIGAVGGIYAGGVAAKGLVGAVGATNASIAGQIQAPGAVTNTTLGAGAVNGGGTVLSGTGTTGAGTFTTNSSTAAGAIAGGGTSLTGTGTTGTGNYSNATATPTVVNANPSLQPGKVCSVDATGVLVCL